MAGCWTVTRVPGPAQRASPPWHLPGISIFNVNSVLTNAVGIPLLTFDSSILSKFSRLSSTGKGYISIVSQCGEPRGFFGKPAHFLESVILALPKSVSSIINIITVTIITLIISTSITISDSLMASYQLRLTSLIQPWQLSYSSTHSTYHQTAITVIIITIVIIITVIIIITIFRLTSLDISGTNLAGSSADCSDPLCDIRGLASRVI